MILHCMFGFICELVLKLNEEISALRTQQKTLVDLLGETATGACSSVMNKLSFAVGKSEIATLNADRYHLPRLYPDEF